MTRMSRTDDVCEHCGAAARAGVACIAPAGTSCRAWWEALTLTIAATVGLARARAALAPRREGEA